MLVWLDADANRAGHPNENLARELMELFTLGIGNYTEADVKEAARALTGWTVDDNRFQFSEARHDAGEKTILGQNWDLHGRSTLLELLLDAPRHGPTGWPGGFAERFSARTSAAKPSFPNWPRDSSPINSTSAGRAKRFCIPSCSFPIRTSAAK